MRRSRLVLLVAGVALASLTSACIPDNGSGPIPLAGPWTLTPDEVTMSQDHPTQTFWLTNHSLVASAEFVSIDITAISDDPSDPMTFSFVDECGGSLPIDPLESCPAHLEISHFGGGGRFHLTMQRRFSGHGGVEADARVRVLPAVN